MKADDHLDLYHQYLTLAGELRVIAHRTGFNEELSGVALALLAMGSIHLEASIELARKDRLMKIYRMLFALIVLAVLLLGVVSVSAQDVTAEPTITPVDTTTPALPPSTETPEDILGIVWAALFGGAAAIGGSVLVTSIVGIAKMIIPGSVVSGDTLKNIVSVVVWLGYSLAIKFGLGTQFQNVAAILAPILTSALPLVGVLIGSAKLYLASKEHNVPILGYQRAPTP